MNDDLLIRFIDGRTTPEETEFVLSELSRDGDAAKEWMQMVQGARLADTKPVEHIDSDEFIARTLGNSSSVQPKGRKVVRLPWIISGITAIAASVAVVVTVMVRHDNNDVPQDFVAEVPDTMVVIPEPDSMSVEEIVDVKDISHHAIAEVVQPKVADPKVDDQEESKSQIEEQTGELTGTKILNDSYTASAVVTEASSLEIIRPAKSPYRVKVQNPEKEFVFEWKMTNVSEVHFSIADNEGKIIIGNERITESSFAVVASDLVDRGELEWTVEVTFNDGTMQRKSGKIELVSAI